MCKFRALRADEIDVRIAQVKEKWFTLLLYKDARCDMNILDETVGAMNWQRAHTRDNANCIVSIWDDERRIWISKEDTGTESNTEKEKGLASDSFKRACFNWGIGRELYTAPFIFVANQEYIKAKNGGNFTVTEKFKVSKIEVSEDKIIRQIEIVDSKGKVVFGGVKTEIKAVAKDIEKITQEQVEELKKLGTNFDDLCIYYKIKSIDELTQSQAAQCIALKIKKINKQKEKVN